MASYYSDFDTDDVPLAQRKTKHLDRFCWNCHKENLYEVKCSNCVLTFHMNCMPDMNRHKVGWKCPECQLAEQPEDCNLGENSLGGLLQSVFDNMVKKNGSVDIPKDYARNKLLVNAMTFNDIAKKVERSEYTSTQAFLFDFKLLRHNCEILYKYEGITEKNRFLNMRNNAKDLLETCVDAIALLKNCGDCYVNDENDAIRVCSKPHLIVWAKYTDYPYWPAKLLQICDTGKLPLNVLFFGSNDTGRVTYANCYLYSKEDPNVNVTEEDGDGIRNAVKDAARYIEQIEKRFGPYRYAPPRTKLIRGKVDTVQYNETIPGFQNPELRAQNLYNQRLPGESSHNDNNIGVPQTVPDQLVNTSKTNYIRISRENVKMLRDDFRDLKAAYESQRARITELQEENETLKQDKFNEKRLNAELKAEMIKLRKRIDALTSDNEVQMTY